MEDKIRKILDQLGLEYVALSRSCPDFTTVERKQMEALDRAVQNVLKAVQDVFVVWLCKDNK